MAYGAGDMQGWRRGMEDAHITILDVMEGAEEMPHDKNISVFGVFDGHGGKEVAKYAAKYFKPILLSTPEFQNGEFDKALTATFLGIDKTLFDPQSEPELAEFRRIPHPSDLREWNQSATTNTNTSSNNGLSLRPKPTDSGSSDDEEGNAKAERLEAYLKLIKEIMTPPEVIEEEEEEEEEGLERNDEMQDEEGKLQMVPAGSGDNEDDEDGVQAPLSSAPRNTVNKMCALQDHRVIAGCTAIVAMLVGTTLYVANAGDSRGVMCRRLQPLDADEAKMNESEENDEEQEEEQQEEQEAQEAQETPQISNAEKIRRSKPEKPNTDQEGVVYETIPLSLDHKPLDPIEHNRIRQAGGFVNDVGRVNGNLNLSRSLGDLKYKCNFDLPQPQQMITADPDIRQFELTEDHEFMVLACDGVWDVLSNEEAIAFVRARILKGMPLEQISAEVMDYCIAEDPGLTGGIGGDNMTCMVVQFKQIV
jgi:protein phosphatase 1G